MSEMNPTSLSSEENPPAPRRTVKVAHLVVGLLFLGISGLWLLHRQHVGGTPDLALSGPALLIAAGVVGLVVAMLNNRNRSTYDDQERS
jgi:hypothetical protein